MSQDNDLMFFYENTAEQSTEMLIKNLFQNQAEIEGFDNVEDFLATHSSIVVH